MYAVKQTDITEKDYAQNDTASAFLDSIAPKGGISTWKVRRQPTVLPHPASLLVQVLAIQSGLGLAARPVAGLEVRMAVQASRTAMARHRSTLTLPVRAISTLNPVVTPI